MGDDSKYIYLLGPSVDGFPYAWNWNNVGLKLGNGSGKFHGRLASKDLEVFKTQCLEFRKPDQISPGNPKLWDSGRKLCHVTVTLSYLWVPVFSFLHCLLPLPCSFLFGFGLFPPLGHFAFFLPRSHGDRQVEFPDWHRGVSTQSPNVGWGQGSTVRPSFVRLLKRVPHVKC